MKRLLALLFFCSLFFIFPRSVQAAQPACWCTGANGNKCTVYSNSCPSNDAVSYEGQTVCCNDKNLYNSVFALKSPICGSALEKPILGCELGTFKDGTQMLFCVGNEFRRGQTDAAFNGVDNQVIDDKVGTTFTYNGNSYTRPGSVYVCNSIASCCAHADEGFKCEDVYKPTPYDPPALVDNNALPNDKRASICGLTGDPNEDYVRYVHTNINDYSLTCADTPVLDVVRDTCSEDAGGLGAPYGKITQVDPVTNQDYIDIQALVSLISAKLGGYGPDQTSTATKPVDAINRIYPYNAFLNRPITESVPQEAFGSFWRLTDQISIMNARAKLIMRFRQQTPPMRDQDIVYAGSKSPAAATGDGKLLAKYMNAIIDGVAGDGKIKLLSPAFNITSSDTPPIVKEMLAAGANFGGLAGCAGNTYTVSGRGAHDWYLDFLNNTGLGGKCNFVFTEFGDFDTFGKPLDGRPDVISRMNAEYNKTAADGSVMGILYFNALGGNSEFTGHKLSQAEYAAITGDAAKAGVNSAKPFDNGDFANAAAAYTNSHGWTLEIAYSPGDAGNVANSINTALSHGLTPIVRICSGATCDFSDPKVYVDFLKSVSSKVSGSFYAIAGPNEPNSETWIEGDQPVATKIESKSVTLSNLINHLPTCLVSYPVCADAAQSYNSLDPDTKIKYDALIPFNQDNLRGYLAVNYIEPVEKRTNVGILTEGLSFIEALRESLVDKNFGLLSSLSPDWLVTKRDSSTTSDAYIPKSQEKNNGSIITAVGEKAKDIWPADTIPDSPKTNQLGCFIHKDGLTLPAPTTYPQDFPVDPPRSDWKINTTPVTKSLYQFVRVPVTTAVTPNSSNCPIKRGNAVVGYGTRYETRVLPGPGLRDAGNYLVSNIGRSIAVLNNPKMTDISKDISEPSGDSDNSLNSMILPDFAKPEKYTKTPLLAQGGSYDSTIFIHTDTATQDKAKAGSSESTSGIISRIGGQAHVDLCLLRNFWLRPAGLQKGLPENCSDSSGIPDAPAINTSATSSAGECSIPSPSFDSTVRAAIDQAHSNPDSNASKVPLALLKAIYEVESFPYFTGAESYSCQENSVGAAGPFQVTKSTYNIVTCDSEKIANDLSVCTSTAGKLSRCSLQDNIELAARIMLFSAGKWQYGPNSCSASGPITDTDKLSIYKAANNYYGSCQPDALTSPYKLSVPLPGNQKPNYGDIVIDKMGLIKSSADYPQPQCQ